MSRLSLLTATPERVSRLVSGLVISGGGQDDSYMLNDVSITNRHLQCNPDIELDQEKLLLHCFMSHAIFKNNFSLCRCHGADVTVQTGNKIKMSQFCHQMSPMRGLPGLL